MSAAAPSLREELLALLAYSPLGEAAGNVTLGSGTLDGHRVHVGLVENRGASGAIGVAEAERLGSIFKVARAERAALVLFLNSAGAKVSEGLRALGAFRRLYAAGLEALFDDTPVAVALGRNCFGGSSMLAHLGRRRLFAADSKLAMSGPAVIAAASGSNPLDEMFRAMVDASIAASRRVEVSPLNTLWSPGMDLGDWLRESLAPAPLPVAERLAKHHVDLAARFPKARAEPRWEEVRRADLDRLYPGGYSARESHGVLTGTARVDDGEVQLVGLLGPTPVRAARAWEFAEAAWKLRGRSLSRVEVLLDCASHAPALDDERLIQTEYIVDMAMALHALAREGAQVGCTVLGKAGGGVYVALAAPASRVTSVYGAADIQVLPGAAVAAILGESRDSAAAFDEYRTAGVAEREAKLGLVPGKK
ncbi:MAG TPA: carboxyl transferase domain-containing protein [Usitatibacter sp.]|nr:carboxyl transferase domain-containing protein [Usitatibacter sp.]